jgi:hypothetical protein
MRGRPFQTVDDAIAGAEKLLKDPNVSDIWYCTSLQQKCDASKGFVTAAKSQEHAMRLKTLRCDFDVKPGEPEKGYETFEDALRDTQRFYKAAKLPPPNVLVKSGGGLHIYWVLDEELEPSKWYPLSLRLKAALKQLGTKADPTVTADSARVLRLPDTINHKGGKQRPVKILFWDDKDYATSDLEKPLWAFTPEADASPGSAAIALPKAFAGEAPSPLLAGMEFEKASNDCENEVPVPDTATVIKECPFMREALLTGGAAYPEPLWDMTVLAAACLPEGVKLAHKFSKGHRDYDKAATETKFNQKAAFVQKGGGWPSCAAIEGHGAPQCAGCVHRGKVKGPLNLGVGGPVVPVVAQVAHAALPAMPASSSLSLPDGYVLDHTGKINKEGVKKDGSPDYVRLFDSILSNPAVHYDPHALSFTSNVGGKHGVDEQVSIEKAKIASMDLLTALAEQNVSVNYQNPHASTDVKAFLMSWMTRCQQRKLAIAHKKLGWIPSGGVTHENDGFMFGGLYMHTDLTKPDTPIGYADASIKEAYAPRGDAKPWHEAAKFTLDQQRTDLDVILASAFAAPLMAYTGETGAVISVWGTSGLGKTTTQQIAAAVWGHPKISRLQVGSTANHLGGKLRLVNSLPVYWDEIKSLANMKELEIACFAIAGGVEKGRMNRDLSLRRAGYWRTILLASSNKSFIDHLEKSMKDTAAGIYRVFEFEAMQTPTDISHWDVGASIAALEKNHGAVGIEYSRILTSLDTKLRDRIKARGKAFDILAGLEKAERYWSVVAACVLVGAEIARDSLGVPFDVQRIEDFLVKAAKDMQKKVTNAGIDTAENVEAHVTAYLKTMMNSTLVTDTAWDIKTKGKAGKPTGSDLYIYVHPTAPGGKAGATKVHWVKNNSLLRLDARSFEDWLVDQDIGKSYIYGVLEKKFGMIRHRRLTLGAATVYSCGNERVIEIPIAGGSEWDTVLSSMAPSP